MRVGRLLLVVATLVTILVFPLMLRDAVTALKLPSAYAAPATADVGGRVYQDGNNNGNDNDNNDGNNDPNNDDNDNRNGNNGSNSINNANDNNDDDEDNDNYACYESLNSNEEVPCDDGDNSDGNDNYYAPAPAPNNPPAPAPSAASDARCFSTGENGQVVLNLSGGSVVLSVVGPGLPSSSRVGLETVSDPSAIAAPPGGAMMLDALLWRVTATSGCSGSATGQISGAVNLGVPYNVSADKSKLQIVYLQGGQWVEVPTVADPDPSKPYISATIQNAGIYAVIQKP